MSEQQKLSARSLRGTLAIDEPMARHVSWRAGGVAARAYTPVNLDDLAAFVRAAPPDEDLCFVGLGSNLLVRDGGFSGTVVFTHGALDGIELVQAQGETLLVVQAGVAAPKVSRFAARHDLIGAEFLAGIPGTVGGALAMNAGCYGGETWHIVESVTTLDRSGELCERTPEEFEIGYRHVQLKDEGGRMKDEEERAPRDAGNFEPIPDLNSDQTAGIETGGMVTASLHPSSFILHPWFVTARFRLATGDGEASRQRIKDFLSRRIATQPLGLPNAGSVFRNPQGDHAARLIEASGLKGYAIGGAQVSTKHANFIINQGAATAAHIEAVIEHVQATVRMKQGIDLVREVRIIGEAAGGGT